MGHVLRRRQDGAVECARCRLYVRDENARSLGRFRRQHCSGSIYDRIDGSHALRQSSGVTWCHRCGGFSCRWLRSLLEPCRGRPLTAARRTILRRLNAGLPPTPQEYLRQAIMDEGAPGDAPDHGGIASWLTNGKVRLPITRGVSSDLPGPRTTAAPSGISCVLPADRGRTAPVNHDPPQPRPEPPQRSVDNDKLVYECKYDGAGGTAGRLKVVAMRSKEHCGGCSRLTATLCRFCGARLCLGCARDKVRCGGSTRTENSVEVAANESDHETAGAVALSQNMGVDGRASRPDRKGHVVSLP